MPRRFEPDSGRGEGANRLKGELIRRNFLFRLALLGPLQTTIAPPTALRAPCLVQGALEQVQREAQQPLVLEARAEEDGREGERAWKT